MRVLIAYESKSGTVAECAALLEWELTGLHVTLSDLAHETPDPCLYDAVIVGGYVRCGRAAPHFSAFLAKNEALLCERLLGLYLCCGETANFEDYTKKLLPATLTAHAFDTDCFGGLLEPERCRGIEKLFVKMMRSSIKNSTEHNEGQYERTLPALLPENIGRMATALRAAIQSEKNPS